MSEPVFPEPGSRLGMGEGRGYQLVRHLRLGRLGSRWQISITVMRRFGDWDTTVKCRRCEQRVQYLWRGLCARCYLHAGGSR